MKFTHDKLVESLRLYAVTDRAWLPEEKSLSEVCEQLLEHGVSFLQIREKNIELSKFEAYARELQELCRKHQVPFVVNDNVELAVKIDADGAHVGQTDLQDRDIRALIGPDKILGISVNTVEEALHAQEVGADYLGVGAVFSTSTKQDARTVSIDMLQEICAATQIPVVAIGGITASNIGQLKGTDIAGVAVVSALFAAEDPACAAAELAQICQEMWPSK